MLHINHKALMNMVLAGLVVKNL